MKPFFAILLTFALSATLSAWQLGKKCTIVLPEKPFNAVVGRALKESADSLKQYLALCGTKAEIRTSVQALRQPDVINLGFPDGRKYTSFSGGITFDGKTVFISGNDRLARKNGNAKGFYSYYLGSVKALTSFMEEYLNARFTFPGPAGIGRLPGKLPELPSKKYQAVTAPLICGSGGRHYGLLYDYANNNYGMGGVYLYGGHSHYTAIPIAKYGKSNPEYFSLLDGMRSNNQKYYSYCHSNPAVRELIYKEMLAKLDGGAEVVELAQTDGYRGCTCDQCRTLFGTTDESEKVWIMHRQMAERLMKDRPGKKVLIISYNPTDVPPKTFRKFPANTMIELCRYTPEEFEKWKKYDVPGGFMAYIYNWGFYQIQGLTPKFTPYQAAEQAKLFIQNNVKGIYRCGFGELFGLEGAGYYVYGKMLENPRADHNRLVEEFCLASFGEAAGGTMLRFYNKLHEALDKNKVPVSEGRGPKEPPMPTRFLTAQYAPGLLNELEALLTSAEGQINAPRGKARIGLVRLQFDYLKNLMTILYFYDAYKLRPSFALLDPLLEMLETRNKLIAEVHSGRLKRFPGITAPLFGISKPHFTTNGRNSAIISVPLTWNIEAIRKFRILPGTSFKKADVLPADGKVGFEFDKGVWKNKPWQELSEIQLGKLVEKSRFKVTFDKENFYVAAECQLPRSKTYKQAGRDNRNWRWDCLELVIDPKGSRQTYYHLIVNPVENSFYDAAVGMITDPLHPLYGSGDPAWNGKWSYKTHREGNVWKVLFTLPFKTLACAAPTPGTKWTFNVCRQTDIDPGNRMAMLELSGWSPCFEGRSFHEKSTFGELTFK